MQTVITIFKEEASGKRSLDLVVAPKTYNRTTKKVEFVQGAVIPAVRNINIGDHYNELESGCTEFVLENKAGVYSLRKGVEPLFKQAGLEWTIGYAGGMFLRLVKRSVAIQLFIKPPQ